MDNQEWREGKFKRGDVWRSKAAYSCGICHTKTNRWVMGGYPGMGPRKICPGDMYQEHDDLESAVERCDDLDKQAKDYETILADADDVDHDRARSMLDNLYVQKELLESKIGKIRRRFTERLDDLQGWQPGDELREYYPCSRIANRKKPLPPTG